MPKISVKTTIYHNLSSEAVALTATVKNTIVVGGMVEGRGALGGRQIGSQMGAGRETEILVLGEE